MQKRHLLNSWTSRS